MSAGIDISSIPLVQGELSNNHDYIHLYYTTVETHDDVQYAVFEQMDESTCHWCGTEKCLTIIARFYKCCLVCLQKNLVTNYSYEYLEKQQGTPYNFTQEFYLKRPFVEGSKHTKSAK